MFTALITEAKNDQKPDTEGLTHSIANHITSLQGDLQSQRNVFSGMYFRVKDRQP